MKKAAALLLISILIITSFISCSKSEKRTIPEHSFPDADYDISATDIAVVGDSIYTIADGSVFKAGETEPALAFDYDAEYITSDGVSLYVYGGGKVTYGDDVITLPQSEITSFVCADGTLCWTYNDNNSSKIGFYNTKNGDTISLKPLFGVDCKVIPYAGSKIFVLCYEISGEMSLYDFDTAAMKTGGILQRNLILNAAYNSSDNSLYMLNGALTGNILERYNTSDGETLTLTPCDSLQSDVKKLLFSGGSLIVLMSDGSIAVRSEYTVSDDGITTVTAIVNESTDFFGKDRLLETVGTLRKDYNIALVIVEHTDADKLRQKQLAGDGDYDLYFADSFNLVLDYPIYEPLDGYPEIIKQFDTMLDDIKRICTYNDKIFGAPVKVDLTNCVMSYNAALLEKLGMELPPADWIIDDFYELAAELRKHDCYISAYRPFWFAHYAWQYFDTYGTGTVTDDGTMLRKMLTVTKKLLKEDLLYKYAEGEIDFNILPENVLFGSTNMQSNFVYSRADVWVNPTFDNERDYYAYTSFLQMNIHSQNKEAAATVIAEFMKPGGAYINPLLGFMYYKDMSVYHLNMTSEQADQYGVIYNDLTDMDEKTAQNMALYLDVLSRVKVKRNYFEWNRFADEESEKYYNDEQDLDYTVELIYNRAKLMLEE